MTNSYAQLAATRRWPRCGHPRTPDNTRYCRNKTGPYERCLECHRASNREWHN